MIFLHNEGFIIFFKFLSFLLILRIIFFFIWACFFYLNINFFGFRCIHRNSLKFNCFYNDLFLFIFLFLISIFFFYYIQIWIWILFIKFDTAFKLKKLIVFLMIIFELIITIWTNIFLHFIFNIYYVLIRNNFDRWRRRWRYLLFINYLFVTKFYLSYIISLFFLRILPVKRILARRPSFTLRAWNIWFLFAWDPFICILVYKYSLIIFRNNFLLLYIWTALWH